MYSSVLIGGFDQGNDVHPEIELFTDDGRTADGISLEVEHAAMGEFVFKISHEFSPVMIVGRAGEREADLLVGKVADQITFAQCWLADAGGFDVIGGQIGRANV